MPGQAVRGRQRAPAARISISAASISPISARSGAAGAQARRRQSSRRGGGGFRRYLFGQFFGGAGRAPQAQARQTGADLEYALNIDFWQAIKGTQVRAEHHAPGVCDTCHGIGIGGGGNTPVARSATARAR